MLFIKVLGKDELYSNRDVYLYIPINSIRKINPVYGKQDEKEPNTFWRYPPYFEGAELLTYKIFDFEGNFYFCNDNESLTKLGVIKPKEREIGFTNMKISEKK